MQSLAVSTGITQEVIHHLRMKLVRKLYDIKCSLEGRNVQTRDFTSKF